MPDSRTALGNVRAVLYYSVQKFKILQRLFVEPKANKYVRLMNKECTFLKV